ncbi:hypothetical protein OIU77_014040 [Salix suchowensis]|uniref:Uncharacterized protein n=1 Tax=Salix suchowensis TaxID=1278906 RepID=A0ABQ8ZVY9_9ROSI|nr:hypothetical protein OIU77_014040 [Salix suchowensis]
MTIPQDVDKIDNDISIYQEAIGKNEQFHPPPPDQLTTSHPQRMGSFHSQFNTLSAVVKIKRHPLYAAGAGGDWFGVFEISDMNIVRYNLSNTV